MDLKKGEKIDVWYGGGGLVECHMPERYFQIDGVDPGEECLRPLEGIFIEMLPKEGLKPDLPRVGLQLRK